MKGYLRKVSLASALSPLFAFALLVGSASSALADVKAGVDAWAQGDYDKAVHEWMPLAQAGDADAQFNLGQAYKLGRGVPADLGKALDYYRQAALQGHNRAEDNYGLLLFQQKRRVEALPYIERSAERGEPRAQYLLGVALFNGDLGTKDWPRAYALMTRASQANLPQAAASLAQMNTYIPEDQRLKGLALAEQMGKQAQGALLSPLSPALPAATTKPVVPAQEPAGAEKTSDLPPSQPAATNATPAPASAVKTAPRKSIRAKAAPATTEAATQAPLPVASRTSAPGKWYVQLGAFGQKQRAERHWKTLSAKVPGLSALPHHIERTGPVIRLQAGPVASQRDAIRLCARVRARGGECIAKPL